MTQPPPSGAPGLTETQQVINAIEQIGEYTPDNCHRALTAYSPYAVGVAGAYLAETASTDGGTGGASSLTDLTDVTGTPGPGKSPVGEPTGTDYLLTRVTTEDDLNAILAQVAAVDWHDIGAAGEPPFAPGWRNIGEPWSPARYRQLANSTVRMQGTITCDDPTIQDATWIPIFTLPPEAAPGENLEFSALTNDNTWSRIYIWADGQVVWAGYIGGVTHAPISRLPLNFLSWSTAGPVSHLADAVKARFQA